MDCTLKLTIWQGETLYTMLEQPMPPNVVIHKYGFLHGGIPMAVLKTIDGVASEIEPLANLLGKLGLNPPDDYLEWAKSPVKILPDRLEVEEMHPKLKECVDAVNAAIPAWQLEQNRLQQLINYSQSQLPVAAAISKIGFDNGFEEYKKSIEKAVESHPALPFFDNKRSLSETPTLDALEDEARRFTDRYMGDEQ